MAGTQFTLDYWIEDEWYVGQLREMPSVVSQGESLAELELHIADAYKLIVTDELDSNLELTGKRQTKQIELAL